MKLRSLLAAGLLPALLTCLAPGAGAEPSPPASADRQLIVHIPRGHCTPARVARLSRDLGIVLHFVRVTGSGACVVRAPATLDRQAFLLLPQQLKRKSRAEAEIDHRFRRRSPPVHPLIDPALQWYLADPVSGIGAARAWRVTTGSPAITVAVLDSGVLYPHPLLHGRLLPGYDMISEDPFPCTPDMPPQLGCPYLVSGDGDGRDPDPSDPGDRIPQAAVDYFGQGKRTTPVNPSSWHGTKVAGIIAATGHPKHGLTGIDRQARVLPVRIAGMHSQLSDLADGIRWAAGLPVPGIPVNRHPAQVINLSLGLDADDAETCPQLLQAAIDDALRHGQTRAIVAAAGNEAQPVLTVPARCRGVIAVGAATRAGTLQPSSNRGPALLISAPTSQLWQPDGNDFPVLSNCGLDRPARFAHQCPDPAAPGAPHSYDVGAGTSISTPMVSATISLMLAANPSLTAGGVRHILQHTARPFAAGSDCARPDAHCGAGLLDAGAAVEQAARWPGGLYEPGHRRGRF